MLSRSSLQAMVDKISSPPRSNILVADDMRSTRLLVSSVLEAKGHRVFEAGTGAAVLDKLKADHYSVVFLNLNMPPHRGKDFVGAVRSISGEARIIVMTADLRERTRNQVIRAGADQVIHPPLRPQQILRSLVSE